MQSSLARLLKHTTPTARSAHTGILLCDTHSCASTTTREQPWVWNAGRASALLVFFDSGSRVLHVSNPGAGCAFPGRRVSDTYHECAELLCPGTPRYIELEHSRTLRVDVEEFVDEVIFPRIARSVSLPWRRAASVEACDGGFLVLGSESPFAGLEDSEAVQVVGPWTREQEPPAPERKHRRQDSLASTSPRKMKRKTLALTWAGLAQWSLRLWRI